MEQLSNPTEVISVEEKGDDEHEGRSDSVYRHEAESSVAEPPGSYLLERRGAFAFK